jgi:drug/metabolite transporter (DMT)-like permease
MNMAGSYASPPVTRELTGRTALGYSLVIAAVTMFSLNASLALFLLEDGLSAMRLSELRAVGSFLVLCVALAILRPSTPLAVSRRDLAELAFLGIAGLAIVYVAYFTAIEELQVGAALTIEYLAPVLLLLWLRLVHGRLLSPALWGAVALSLAGCILVVRAYDLGALNALGLAAGLVAAISYAIYLAGSERAGHRHPPHVTVFWAFAFASLFWLLIQPPWTFPTEQLDGGGDLALALAVIVIGTLLPYGLFVVAVRHVPAARAAAVATLEPALSALFAYLIHDEALAAVQLAGIAIVLAAVAWIQMQRPDIAAESIPVSRSEPIVKKR